MAFRFYSGLISQIHEWSTPAHACMCATPETWCAHNNCFCERHDKMTDFKTLNLSNRIMRAIEAEGYETATPIQAQTIPPLLEGRDVMGVAQTGTGKTASFALPLLHGLAENTAWAEARKPKALILAPTRELAVQIHDSIKTYGKGVKMRSTVVFGGSSIRAQMKAMDRGVHILVATPGRLMDLFNQGYVKFSEVETFILDEADRMLDMGFINDVKKVAGLMPKDRQTVLFSATMPRQVAKLAEDLLSDPVRVSVAPESTTAEKVDQKVYFLPKDKKRSLLGDLLQNPKLERVLVFTRTKRGADRVNKFFTQIGVPADAIHGDKKQTARQRALRDFKSGKIRVLVATDIAARGIDVENVTHVINYELPNEPESYVHRIGRTARGGAKGIALSFCDMEEKAYLRDIEKTTRQKLEVVVDHPFHAPEIAHMREEAPQKKGRGGGGRGSNGGGGGNASGKKQPWYTRRKSKGAKRRRNAAA